jgi:hypothetical protein
MEPLQSNDGEQCKSLGAHTKGRRRRRRRRKLTVKVGGCIEYLQEVLSRGIKNGELWLEAKKFFHGFVEGKMLKASCF